MTRSLRFRLLARLLFGLIVAWFAVGAVTWWWSSVEVNKVFDARLLEVARLLAVSVRHEARELDLAGYEHEFYRQPYDSPLLFQVWSADGRLIVRGPGAPPAPLSVSSTQGYTDESLYGLEDWRVLTVVYEDMDYRVQVADTYQAREELARFFVFRVLQPMILALPILALVLWGGVERGLAPLRWLAREVSRRSHSSLEPVRAKDVPTEVGTIVQELNRLLSRLQEALDRYARFTADAAHELRTPLAATRVQAQAALRARNESEQQSALQQVVRGVDRATHLVEQLLTLARIAPEEAVTEFADLELSGVAERALSELSGKASAKGVEVKLVNGGGAAISGNRELIGVLLRNLLENAVRATPEGGRVTVRVGSEAGGRYLSVEDTGPGIPDAAKQQVMERFHRLPDTPGAGSGLGLSIVQAIARLHGASLLLNDRDDGSGLRVTVGFPA